MYLELSHDAVKLRSKINREMELTPSPYRFVKIFILFI